MKINNISLFFVLAEASSNVGWAKNPIIGGIIGKSPIWYRYKEGFNNAVRKDVFMKDLL